MIPLGLAEAHHRMARKAARTWRRRRIFTILVGGFCAVMSVVNLLLLLVATEHLVGRILNGVAAALCAGSVALMHHSLRRHVAPTIALVAEWEREAREELTAARSSIGGGS